MKSIIMKYGELWLKSEPVRSRFIRSLRDSARSQLRAAGIRDASFDNRRDSMVLKTKSITKAMEILPKVFGISSFSATEEVGSDMKSIEKAALGLAKSIGHGETFAVRASRNDKTFPLSSMQIEKRIGDRIDRKADLSKPDRTIFVEVKRKHSYVHTEKVRGLGGLPYGVSGKLLSLRSGQFDSPVAS